MELASVKSGFKLVNATKSLTPKNIAQAKGYFLYSAIALIIGGAVKVWKHPAAKGEW